MPDLDACLEQLNSIAKSVGPSSVTTADGTKVDARSLDELMRFQKQLAKNRLAKLGLKGIGICSLRQNDSGC